MLNLDHLPPKSWYQVTIEHESHRYVYQIKAAAATYAVRLALFAQLKVCDWSVADTREWALMDLNEIMTCLPDVGILCEAGEEPQDLGESEGGMLN